MKKIIAALALALLGVFALPSVAQATENPNNILAAWRINTPGFNGSTVTNVWGGGGQTLVAYIEVDPIDETDLTQLNTGYLPCGAWYQIDLYKNDATTAALLHSGTTLKAGYGSGQQEYPESPANVNPWYVSYQYSGDCLPEPALTPFEDSSLSQNCDTVTTTYRTGYFEHTFNPVTNVWTDAEQPTITDSVNEERPTTPEERADQNCVTETPTPTETPEPELAHTGAKDQTGLWILSGGLFVLGVILMWYNSKKRRPRL